MVPMISVMAAAMASRIGWKINWINFSIAGARTLVMASKRMSYHASGIMS